MKLWSHSVAQAIASHDPTINPDAQEALSRRYSDDIMIMLALSSGNIAVFNSARQLCAIVGPSLEAIVNAWHPPEKNWNTEHVQPKKVDPSDMEFL